MKGTMWISAVLAVLILLSGSAFSQGFATQYQGELIDDQARPLAGVFALTFKLYPELDSAEPLWEESHYLTVVEGQYTVRLGEATPLDSQWSDTEMFVAVEFMGQEIVRESQRLVAVPDTEAEEQDPLERLREVLAGRVVEVTFAQLADRALLAQDAEHAANADRLEGRTLAEIDRYDELVEMFAEHQIDPEAHGGRVQAPSRTTGDSTMVLQRVGGEGGTPYTRMCPRGYVVVGIQGAAGGFIDSLQIVCAPLE